MTEKHRRGKSRDGVVSEVRSTIVRVDSPPFTLKIPLSSTISGLGGRRLKRRKKNKKIILEREE